MPRKIINVGRVKGTMWYSGTDYQEVVNPLDGDLYLNTENFKIYIYTHKQWQLSINLTEYFTTEILLNEGNVVEAEAFDIATAETYDEASEKQVPTSKAISDYIKKLRYETIIKEVRIISSLNTIYNSFTELSKVTDQEEGTILVCKTNRKLPLVLYRWDAAEQLWIYVDDVREGTIYYLEKDSGGFKAYTVLCFDGEVFRQLSANDDEIKKLIPKKVSELENDANYAVVDNTVKYVNITNSDITIKEMYDTYWKDEFYVVKFLYNATRLYLIKIVSAGNMYLVDVASLENGKYCVSTVSDSKKFKEIIPTLSYSPELALKNELPKDKHDIGLGNVDNTSDLNKPVSTATQTLINKISDDLATTNAIAKGANKSISFANYQSVISMLKSVSNYDTYNVGQNIYIVKLNIPDLWISKRYTSYADYTYSNDETFINALKTTGYVRVGYYELSALETQKVDLTDYVKFDSNARFNSIEVNQQITVGGKAVATQDNIPTKVSELTNDAGYADEQRVTEIIDENSEEIEKIELEEVETLSIATSTNYDLESDEQVLTPKAMKDYVDTKLGDIETLLEAI